MGTINIGIINKCEIYVNTEFGSDTDFNFWTTFIAVH